MHEVRERSFELRFSDMINFDPAIFVKILVKIFRNVRPYVLDAIFPRLGYTINFFIPYVASKKNVLIFWRIDIRMALALFVVRIFE